MGESIAPEGAEHWKPETSEGASALIAFDTLLDIKDKLSAASTKDERARVYQDTTEDQFLISHYVWKSSGDQRGLKDFWDKSRAAAALKGKEREFFESKKGILSQVAALKVFEQLGEKPVLAHPKEDAFTAIDMWTEDESAIQIKGAPIEHAAVIESNTISFPTVEAKTAESSKFYSTKFAEAAKQFQVKTERYQKTLGHPIKSYFLVLPVNQIDLITGEPTPGLVNEVRKLLHKDSEGSKAA